MIRENLDNLKILYEIFKNLYNLISIDYEYFFLKKIHDKLVEYVFGFKVIISVNFSIHFFLIF